MFRYSYRKTLSIVQHSTDTHPATSVRLNPRAPLRASLLLLLLILSQTASAQLYLGLRGGVTLPKGTYAESRMSDNEWMFTEGHQHKGGAGRGWNAGLDIAYAIPLPISNAGSSSAIELLLSADFMQSGLSRDISDYYEFSYPHRYDRCSLYEMQLPRIRHIPILAGIRFDYPLTSGIKLYAEALAGINLRRITDWSLTFADNSYTQSDGQTFAQYANTDIRRYAPANTLGLRFGVGIIAKERLTLGATLNHLGNAPLIWDRTTTTAYSIYGQPIQNTTTQHVAYTPLKALILAVNLSYRLPLTSSRHIQDW